MSRLGSNASLWSDRSVDLSRRLNWWRGRAFTVPDLSVVSLSHPDSFILLTSHLSECSECPTVPPTAPALQEGEDYLVETTGCCPVTRAVCRPETCPPPALECPHHLARVRDISYNSSCCAKYKCGEAQYRVPSIIIIINV